MNSNNSAQYTAIATMETDKAESVQDVNSGDSIAPLVPEPDIVFDKGPRAIAALVGGFCASVATFGSVNAFGVYQDFYTRSGTASPSAISWIGSTQLFFIFAMGLVGGKLLDIGYFRHTIFLGSVIYVFCLFMLSLAHVDKYWQLYLSQGLGMGIGAGLIYVPALALQSHHWRKHRAVALGIVVTGSSLGGIIFPIMLNQLINGSVGFAWGVRASAFVNLGLLIVANILMTPNAALAALEKPKPDMKGILMDFPFILGNTAVLIIDWGMFLPYFYLQLYAILHNVNSTVAFYMIAVLNASAIPGRIIPSILADKYGSFNAFIVSGIGSGILIFGLFGISSVAGITIFAILYGFFSGAFLSLTSPVIASFSRHPSEAGVRFGIAFFMTSFGVLTGTPIGGALLGDSFQWSKLIAFGGVVIVVGMFLLFISRHYVAVRKGTPWV